MDDLPATKRDIEDLRKTLRAIKDAAEAPTPDVPSLNERRGRLLQFGKQVAAWSGGRATKLADATLESGGKTLGPTLALSIVGLLPHVFEIAEAIEKFIKALSL